MHFLVFAGTTEGRRVLELLAESGKEATVCVATEYGGEVFSSYPGCEVRVGRLDEAGMERLLRERRFDAVLDATHPHAAAVTENLRAACSACGADYVRVLRGRQAEDACVRVPDAAAAADFLSATTGRVLLTTGSKELDVFTRVPDYRARLFPRVLPVAESLGRCLGLGFPARNIMCMQGPFTEEMNLATLRQIGARCLVTKDSGGTGGFAEKCAAARAAGAQLVVIGRPQEEEQGIGVRDLPALLRDRWGITPRREEIPFFPLFISLRGKTALVVGAGAIAARRIRALCGFGCMVRVVSPVGGPDVERLDASGQIRWERRPYRPGDCSGAALAVAATDDRAVNKQVGEECRQAGIPVSVADRREECSFYFPGTVCRGGVSVGVTAAGDHRLARRITGRIRADAAHWEEEQDG